MNIEQIEARLRAAIEKAQAEGTALVPGEWGFVFNNHGETAAVVTTVGKCACAIGCLVRAEGIAQVGYADEYADVAAEALGVPAYWVEAFVGGFDGRSGPWTPLDVNTQRRLDELAAFKLGAKLRAEYLGTSRLVD